MKDVAVVIVSYNTRELTLAAIGSVISQTSECSYQIVVVDNCSSDGSVEAIEAEFPQIQLVKLESNVGFARANNIAAAGIDSQYILLLNPDTVVLDGAIDRLVEFAKSHQDYGVYGGSTFFADGSRNPTSGWNIPTFWSLFCTGTGLSSVFRGSRVFDPESLTGRAWDQPMQVGIVTGCFMLLPTCLWRDLGGFDDRFYMYGEDADLSYRAKQAGRPCVIVPSARLIHYGGASETVRADKLVKLLRAKVQFFRKHWRSARVAYSVFMLKLWVLTRKVYYGPRRKGPASDEYHGWAGAWRRRAEWANPI